MWRLLQAVKRERNTSTTVRLLNKTFQSQQKKNVLRNQHQHHIRSTLTRGLSTSGSSPDVAVQLDYYMSLQFAGVACALVNGTLRVVWIVWCTYHVLIDDCMCIHIAASEVLWDERASALWWWPTHKRLQNRWLSWAHGAHITSLDVRAYDTIYDIVFKYNIYITLHL